MPRRRGPTLLIANHQHEIESMVIVSRETVASSWTQLIYTVSSRRMYEPGFMAVRTPWLAAVLRRVNPGPLFVAIGMLPIENQLSSRALASLAWIVERSHGDLALAQLFPASTLEPLGLTATRISQLWRPEHFAAAQRQVRLVKLREPYRREILDRMRAQLDEDFKRIEDTVRAGATFFFAPEGHYSRDGRLRPFLGLLPRLTPLAAVYLAAVSYDPLRGRRFSMLYRVLKPQTPDDLPNSLRAARPVTVSQLLAAWLQDRNEPFDADDAVAAVTTRLRRLPPEIFVDPEVIADPARTVQQALTTCARSGLLEVTSGHYRRTRHVTHPQFPLVDNIIAYQARFFEETLAGAAALAGTAAGFVSTLL